MARRVRRIRRRYSTDPAKPRSSRHEPSGRRGPRTQRHPINSPVPVPPASVVNPSLIAVVGNAESIFDNENGHLIDECDMVIRFNAGKIVNPAAQGSKTSIHAFSLNRFGKDKPFGVVQLLHIKPDTLERRYLENILGIKPSNGIVVLERLRRMSVKQVRLFGFDWKDTPTWYPDPIGDRISELNPMLAVESHDYEKEREYCLKLIELHKWELHQ